MPFSLVGQIFQCYVSEVRIDIDPAVVSFSFKVIAHLASVYLNIPHIG